MLHLGPGWKLHPCPSSPHRQPERSCRDKDKTDWLQNALPQNVNVQTKKESGRVISSSFLNIFFHSKSLYKIINLANFWAPFWTTMLCCPEMSNRTATKWWGIPCIGFHSQPDPSPESSTIPFLGCWLKTPPKHPTKKRQKPFRDQMLHLGPG